MGTENMPSGWEGWGERPRMDRQPEPIGIGTRVRHIGEQYDKAIDRGTGTVMAVLRYYPIDRSYEYLVSCDEAPWGGDKRLVERNHIVAVDSAYAYEYAARFEAERKLLEERPLTTLTEVLADRAKNDPVESLIQRSSATEVLVVQDGEPVGFLKREER